MCAKAKFPSFPSNIILTGMHCSYRWDMTDEEAIDLGKRAIYHATYRDAYSGGVNNGPCVDLHGLVKM